MTWSLSAPSLWKEEWQHAAGDIKVIHFLSGATFGLKNPEFPLSPVVLLLLSRKELHHWSPGTAFPGFQLSKALTACLILPPWLHVSELIWLHDSKTSGTGDFNASARYPALRFPQKPSAQPRGTQSHGLRDGGSSPPPPRDPLLQLCAGSGCWSGLRFLHSSMKRWFPAALM